MASDYWSLWDLYRTAKFCLQYYRLDKRFGGDFDLCSAPGRQDAFTDFYIHNNYSLIPVVNMMDLTVFIYHKYKGGTPTEPQWLVELFQKVQELEVEIMNKPNGYDEARVAGEFVPVQLGGHYAIIKQVTETESKTHKPMIVVLYDFDKADKQAGYFMKSFKEDVRPDKKWPYQGTKYIMVNDYNDASKTSKDFKTFCSCVEKSNNCSVGWGEEWGKQFKGKKIGVVFGDVESEYNGEVKTRPEPRWFCKTDAVADANIPDVKRLNPASRPNPVSASNDTSFLDIPDGDDDEIPFN